MSHSFPKAPVSSDGVVITIEGIDGAGTTTQADLLVQKLENIGMEAVRTQEPTNGLIGRIVRSSLRQNAEAQFIEPAGLALLFAADRLEHLERVVKPALLRKAVVVTDRSVFSSLAYQGMELDESWVATINAQAPMPHVFVWIDVPASISMERIEQRDGVRERYEKLELLETLSRRYRDLVKKGLDGVQILHIDGTQDVTQVSECIWTGLREMGCIGG
jgi:dTMP kinase